VLGKAAKRPYGVVVYTLSALDGMYDYY